MTAPWGGGMHRFTSTLRTRAALGLRPATTPLMVLVPLGALLGPSGIGILTLRSLAYLDVVISIALATLGVFVGIAAGTQSGAVRRFLTASLSEGLVTTVVVMVACFVLVVTWGLPLNLSPAIAAAALGVAAAASAAPYAADEDNRSRRVAARVADLDDVLPILLGGIVLSLVSSGGRDMVVHLGATILVGLGVGVSGWLLFERTEGAERGVFVVGTLTLVGGAAAYLELSPLLAGMVTGFFWAVAPGRADRIAASDLRKVEHPLIVLLLIAAGAGLQPTLMGIWLLAPYVLFRTAGKLLGGWLASRVAPEVAPADLGAYLVPPGALGIAFTLNIQQIAPDAAAPLVFAVTLGAVMSELLGLIVMPAPRAA